MAFILCISCIILFMASVKLVSAVAFVFAVEAAELDTVSVPVEAALFSVLAESDGDPVSLLDASPHAARTTIAKMLDTKVSFM